jgi:hypothetical protein
VHPRLLLNTKSGIAINIEIQVIGDQAFIKRIESPSRSLTVSLIPWIKHL